MCCRLCDEGCAYVVATMQNSFCDQRDLCQRHFTDVFGCLTTACDDSSLDQDKTKLIRRPKCQTKNTIPRSLCQETKSFLMEVSQSQRIVKTNDGSAISENAVYPEVISQVAADQSIKCSLSLPVSDILCVIIPDEANVTAHQAVAVQRLLLPCSQASQAANALLLRMLTVSKCPVVTHICSRVLQHICRPSYNVSCTMLSILESHLSSADIISYVIVLHKEILKFLKNGRYTMTLLNVICILEFISTICSSILNGCRKQRKTPRVGSRICSQFCAAEFRHCLLIVASLANCISDRVTSRSSYSNAIDASSNSPTDSLQCSSIERVAQIINVMLAMSLWCETVRSQNLGRVINEYWNATDCHQRKLIVEAVSSPKHRLELCCCVLARHCEVSTHKFSCLSLDDIFNGTFTANVVACSVAQQVWMEASSSSISSYCQEICVLLYLAASSYILFRKETQGQLLDQDILVLQRLPDYTETLKKRFSEISHGSHIMNVVSRSALDRLACLADIHCIEL